MFKVPLIPPDLRHEETIIQAAHALACLEKNIFSVFDSIDNRVKKNESKLQKINHRIKRAHERIVGSEGSGLQGLVGSKKSITIYSPSRFPGTQILREDVSSTYIEVTNSSSKEMDSFTQENEQNPIKSRFDQPLAHNEKLVFFHVRSVPEWHRQNEINATRIANGFGLVPEEISYVTSTLRFNSDDYVYDSTSNSSTDSWKQVKLFKRGKHPLQQARSAVRGPQLAPAPHSLTHRDHKASQALRYTPRLRDLPRMDLPIDLPDLPGIADDIQFVAQEQQRIAPSLLIDDLPDLEELEKQQQLQISDVKNSQSAMKTTEMPITEDQTVVQNLPKPPPPATINLIVSHPPPPPPPPPPQLSNIPEALASHDMRSDLMAAIRKAGGVERARLRPAAPINTAVTYESDGVDSNIKDTKKFTSVNTGGGLMAELHSKLLLRRKGISGAKDKENEEKQTGSSSNNPLLSHLSSLIPQTKIRRHAEQVDDEDDWVD